MNRIIISGRLAQDPERMELGEGVVTNVTLAVHRPVKEGATAGVEFIRVACWNRPGNALADNVALYNQRGSMVLVEGTLRQRRWADRDGNRRTTFEVAAASVEFLSRKQPKDGEAANGPASDDDLAF